MKSKGERETFKATREKQHFTYRRTWFKESQISPEGNGTFFKSCQHTILCPVKKEILQQWGWNKNILRWKTHKRLHCHQFCCFRMRNDTKKENWNIKNEGKTAEKAHTEVNVIDCSSPLEFLNFVWWWKTKVIALSSMFNVYWYSKYNNGNIKKGG